MTQMASSGFVDWLNAKLRELNTDESVFGSYIVGILEGDESNEEKTDAVEGILSEIIEDNLQELVTEILNKWSECHAKEVAASKPTVAIDVNEQLARLLEAQKLPTIKERVYTEEDRKIKEQILAHYSQTEVADEEFEESGDETTQQQAAKTSSCGIERNTNALDVMQLQKDRREQSRQDSAAKKLKDKEDREKQKQMREDKKEKRKTVKGERRR